MPQKGVVVRPYRSGDETDLVLCWNRNLPIDAITGRIFVEKVLCDQNFDPQGLQVAEDPEGRIVGFLLGVVRKTPLQGTDVEPADGWITSFAVDSGFRHQGLAQRMLAAGEEFLKHHGRKNAFFAPYAPYYFVPGIDRSNYQAGGRFLAAAGYQELYECVAMDMSIATFTIPTDVRELLTERKAEGYSFAALRPEYVAETIRLAGEHFHADWARAVREGLQKGVAYDRFLVALDPNSRVVGFCMYGGYDYSPDRFGPFGVHPDQRGKGLGKALLYLCLDAMRTQGLHDAWFLWTGENSPAGRLYQRAGFTVTRRFSVVKKVLS